MFKLRGSGIMVKAKGQPSPDEKECMNEPWKFLVTFTPSATTDSGAGISIPVTTSDVKHVSVPPRSNDKTIVDTYSLGTDASGKLVSGLKSVPTDTSNSPSVNAALNFFTNFNGISNAVRNQVRDFAGIRLQIMPIATIQDSVSGREDVYLQECGVFGLPRFGWFRFSCGYEGAGKCGCWEAACDGDGSQPAADGGGNYPRIAAAFDDEVWHA